MFGSLNYLVLICHRITILQNANIMKLDQYLKNREIQRAQVIKGLNEAKNYIDLDLNEQTKKHLATLIMRQLDSHK